LDQEAERQGGIDDSSIVSIVESLLQQPSPDESPSARLERAQPFLTPGGLRVDRSRLLPFDIYLNRGNGSVRLFAAGPFDELSFFQRRDVVEKHELEYLTYLDARHVGKERYEAYGVFNLKTRNPRRLPNLAVAADFWRALRSHGLKAVPGAKVAVRQSFSVFCSAQNPDAGRNRVNVAACRGVFERDGQRALPHADLLEIMRNDVEPAYRIAWLEGAMARPRQGEIMHRYYLDAGLRAYLVRDHWQTGRTFYTLQSSGGDGARGLLIYR
jgi:hypothetical protein